MIEILVVIPYEELHEEYADAIRRAKVRGINFTTKYIYGTAKSSLGGLDKYDVVVVRGMTSKAVSRLYPNINKIDILISSSDVFDSLAIANRHYPGQKIGIILPDLSICVPDSIEEITGFDIAYREVDEEKKLYSVVDELYEKEQCRVFIGGLTLKGVCQKRGYNYIQISTGKATIEKSIQDAVVAAHIMNQERTRSNLLRALVDNLSHAMLAVNQDGEIVAANHGAESLFKSNRLVGATISSVAPNLFIDYGLAETNSFEIVQSIKDKTMLITQKPFSLDGTALGLLISLQNVDDIYAIEKKVRSTLSSKGLTARYTFSDILAEQLSMKQIIAKAIRYSAVEGTVLITGETGTGKELFAQSMHNASQRARGPFVAINCAAISDQLLESELFGYTEGAFTGAAKGGKSGLFEQAHGGTIFLDEIGEMPMQLQAKLLRVLQEKEVRRIGGVEVIPVDVRVMSATNQNIPELIEKGLFRRDLYYRLNLLSLYIPPLRERLNDIGVLFDHFIQLNALRMGVKKPEITNDAIAELYKYRWLGNIRELRNVAERIIVLFGSERITAKAIAELDIPLSEKLSKDESKDIPNKRKILTDEGLYEEYLGSGLTLANFASQIGISRTTLWRKFKNIKDDVS